MCIYMCVCVWISAEKEVVQQQPFYLYRYIFEARKDEDEEIL